MSCYLSNVTVTPSQTVTKEGDICTCRTRGTDAELNAEREAREMKEGGQRERERKRVRWEAGGVSGSVFSVVSVV